MIDYKRWKQLNESLGFPLSLKAPQTLGLSGLGVDYNDLLDERKKGKKKMDGEINVGADDDNDDDHDMDDDKGGCSCDKKPKAPPVGDNDGDDDDDDRDSDVNAAGQMGPNKMMMKKKMKKKMKAESFAEKLNREYAVSHDEPELGTPEYAKAFRDSLARQFGNPFEKFSDGKPSPTSEDVVLPPPTDAGALPVDTAEEASPLGPKWDAHWAKLAGF